MAHIVTINVWGASSPTACWYAVAVLYELRVNWLFTRRSAYQHAVGELAPQTFIGNDMRHNYFSFRLIVPTRVSSTSGAGLPMHFGEMGSYLPVRRPSIECSMTSRSSCTSKGFR